MYSYRGAVHPRAGTLAAIHRKDRFGKSTILSGLNDPEDRFADRSFELSNGLPYRTQREVNGSFKAQGTAHLAHLTGPLPKIERSFDPSGNPLAIVQANHTQPLSIDPASNRILAKGDERYQYDANGALIQAGKRALRYDSQQRLIAVLDAETPIAEYRYNAFGERIKKITHSAQGQKVTYYFHDGAHISAEADASGKITRQYVWLDEAERSLPIALLEGDEIYAIHADQRGAPMAVTDEDQDIVWQAAVDPWGKTRTTLAKVSLNLRGSNQYFDQETGLHYNTRRYYDPEIGRYLTPDPLGQKGGLNLYAFANNDPLNFTDPLGLQAKPVSGDISGWSTERRLQYIIDKTIPKLPAEIGEALKEMVSPEAIATTAAIFGVWAASHAVGVGVVADAALVVAGTLFLGKAVIDVGMAFYDLAKVLLSANCISELDAASDSLAKGLGSAAAAATAGTGAVGLAKVAGAIRKVLRRTELPKPEVGSGPPVKDPEGTPSSVPGRVRTRINITSKAMVHIRSRHFSGKLNASQFSISEQELRLLLSSKTVIDTPISRTLDSVDGIRYVREFSAGKTIGNDRFDENRATQILTIMTDSFGNLVTAFPGVLK